MKSLYAVLWLNKLGVCNTINAVAETGVEAMLKSQNSAPAEFNQLFEIKHLGWIHCE